MCSQHDTATPATRRPSSVNGAACAWLAAGCFSAALLIVLSWLDATSLGMPRVVGSLLAAGVAVGASGFIVNVGIEQVLQRLAQLEAAVSRQQVTYVPIPRPAAHTYTSEMARSVGIVRSEEPVGLDADTIASARTIARRLLSGGDLPEQQSQPN